MLFCNKSLIKTLYELLEQRSIPCSRHIQNVLADWGRILEQFFFPENLDLGIQRQQVSSLQLSCLHHLQHHHSVRLKFNHFDSYIINMDTSFIINMDIPVPTNFILMDTTFIIMDITALTKFIMDITSTTYFRDIASFTGGCLSVTRFIITEDGVAVSIFPTFRSDLRIFYLHVYQCIDCNGTLL